MRWLDIEATVDDNDEFDDGEFEDDDELAAFIRTSEDDDDVQVDERVQMQAAFDSVDMNLGGQEDEFWDAFFLRNRDRGYEGGMQEEDGPLADCSRQFESVHMQPDPATDNLFRVKCLFGWESRVCTALMHLTGHTTKMLFKCVFAKPATRGFVYVELLSLLSVDEAMDTLKYLPGVFVSHGKLVFERIPPDEWIYTLVHGTPDSLSVDQKSGSWVRILTGLYRGDVGRLVSTDVVTASAKVDMIPRVRIHFDEHTQLNPRRSLPCLLSEKQAKLIRKGLVHSGGLVQLEFALESLSSRDVNMASSLAELWSQSAVSRTVLDTLPYYHLESLQPGDKVCWPRTAKQVHKGTVVEVIGTDVHVTHSDEEDDHTDMSYPLAETLRRFRVFDYVCCTKTGRCGWIQDIGEWKWATVLEKIPEQSAAREFASHVNNLRQTSEPTRAAQRQSDVGRQTPIEEELPDIRYLHDQHIVGDAVDGEVGKKGTALWEALRDEAKKCLASLSTTRQNVPWINTIVLFVGAQNSLKGRFGMVVDTLSNQPTSSGLRLIVRELTVRSASAPTTTYTVDYDAVVHARTLWPLKIAIPLTPSQREYNPRVVTPDIGVDRMYFQAELTTGDSDGAHTPLQSERDQEESSTLSTAELTALAEESGKINWIFHPSLVGKILAVHRKGKTVRAYVRTRKGDHGLLIVEEKLKTSYQAVDSANITPWLPTVHDYGRWIVARGVHCGSYVRGLKIDRKREPATWEVAVVIPNSGDAEDEDTGARLCIPVPDLCIALETSKETKQNIRWKTEMRERLAHTKRPGTT